MSHHVTVTWLYIIPRSHPLPVEIHHFVHPNIQEHRKIVFTFRLIRAMLTTSLFLPHEVMYHIALAFSYRNIDQWTICILLH